MQLFRTTAVVGIRICPVLRLFRCLLVLILRVSNQSLHGRYETRSGLLIPEKKRLLLRTRRRNNSYPSSTNDGALSDLMRGMNKYSFCTRASLCTWTLCLTDIKAFSPDSFVKSLNLSRNNSE